MSNKNYKGSIELASGLKPKNNGDFPLVEAHSVAFYNEDGTEIRLDEKIEQVGVSEEDRANIINDATEKVFTDTRYTGLSENIDKNSSAIFASGTGLNSRVADLETQIEEGDNQELKIQFEEKESMLYLYAGDTLIKPNPDDDSVVSNVIASTNITGGGGAGASLNYALTLRQLNNNALTFLHTDTPKLQYHAKFIDTSAEEGEDNLVSQTINFKMTVILPSGAKNSYSFTGLSNTDLEYDLTQILSSSTGLILGDHNITLTASYTQEVEANGEILPITIQSTKKWTVKITEMYLTSTFDDSAIRTADVPLSVVVFGDLNKTIHYKLGGQDDWRTVEAPMSNYEYSITIPKQAHGNYPLEVYLTASVNGETIRSNSLFFDIMFKDEGNNKPIIRAVPASAKGQQYSNLPIYYSVYSPDSLISKVELAVDGKVTSSLDIDRSEQVWNFKSSTEGLKTLTIKCGKTVRTLPIEIEKIPYTIESVTAGLELDFSPQGRTNQDSDYNVFKNNVFDEDGNEVPLTWTLSENFDWVNGGWKVDENDDAYFCIKAGTSVDINYLLFNDPYTLVGANKAKGNGKEFKIIFKTTNVAKADTTWLSCIAAPEIGDPLGIQMDAHTGYIKTSSGTHYLSVPYSEEDKIEFDVNIVPITYKASGEIDLTVKDIPMIMTYEDGTPVRPLVLNNDQISFKQANPVPITIGSPYCDVHIYRIKAYSTFLSEKNILNNFIADASNGEEMIARHIRNQIYDAKTGKLTPESFAAACPDMRVIKISAPKFTNDKKDKVLETTIQMIHKNGDPVLDNWIATNGRHNGQGTSSNAYGYSGRNLELSLKEKEALRYKITKPEGVYNKDGEQVLFGTIVEGKQDFYDSPDEETRQKYEDATTIAEVITIPGTKITLGDGTTTKKVSLTRDSVPTNYFNIKVNIASSEQANNAILQKRFDRYLPYTSLAKAKDSKVKNNMNFYNCVIFVQETNEDLTTHREFNDNDWHFYSMGNIGDSKKTDDSRANDPDDTTEFCVEVMDWNRELSAFPQDTKVKGTTEKYVKKDADGNITGYIFITEDNLKAGVLFERDYSLEDYQENVDGNWISYGYKISTDSSLDTGNLDKYYIDILEQDDFSEDFTYGFRYLNDDEDSEQIETAKAKWIEFYRFITRDNCYDDRRADKDGKWLEDPEKVAEWKSEFENWFIKDAAFYYYLFTLRYTMVDNRAKNSFWHWGKCLDGKYRMDFWDYDNDTALGIDNTGKFTMSYGVEDHDVNESGAAHFRAHHSTFFVRVADYFANDLISYYKDTLENKDSSVFSSTSLINEFDSWQSEFPEEIWRLQYERAYKRTYVGGYGTEWDNVVNPEQIKKAADPQFLTEMMNGKKKYQRRQFERNQDIYMSSKFFGNAVFQDYIQLRGGGDMDANKLIVKPNGDITITPYLNMYVNTSVEHNSTFNHHVKVKAGESVTLAYPTTRLEFNYVYGASYLQSLGDLSAMYLRVAKLGQGRRMKQLVLGNGTNGYDNPNLEAVEITSNNKLLEELDVRNMSKLGGNIPIGAIPSLRKLYAQGTSYQTVQFANSGLIEEAYLPASIQIISANNLYYLRTLQLDGYNNLQSLLINNCPKLKEQGFDLTIVKNATNLKTVRLTNIEWHLETTDVLNRLYNCTGIGEDNTTPIDKSVLTGYVYVDAIRKTELDNYKAQWPQLEVGYGRIIPQFDLNFYNSEDATTPFFSYKVDTNTTLYPEIHDPALNGMLSKNELPVKPDSEDGQYTYKFKTWNPSIEPTLNDQGEEQYLIVTENMSFYPVFESEIKKYKVTWYGYNKVQLDQQEVAYGSDAYYQGAELPTRTNQTDAYFLFGGWESSTSNITKDLDVYPVWLEANPGAIKTEGSENLSPTEIYSLAQYTKDQNYNFTQFNKYIGVSDKVTVQMGYMPDYDNVESRVFTEAMKTYTDSKAEVVNTGETLFSPNQSFTLAIDFTPGYVESGKLNAFAACRASDGRGFRLYAPQNSENNLSGTVTPRLQGFSSEVKKLYPSDNNLTTPTEQFREICIIRYEAGSKELQLYSNNRFSLDDVYVQTLSVTNLWEEFSAPLCFGGIVSETGGYTTGSYAKGTIHYAKLWKDALEDSECKKICSWIYDSMTFEQVGTGRYNYSSSQKVTASFVATELMERPMKFYNLNSQASGALYPGYKDSLVREWINKKVLKGFSPEWQQVLRPTIYSALEGTNPNKITSIKNENDAVGYYESKQYSDKLFIPALLEIIDSIGTVNDAAFDKYKSDKGTDADILSCFETFSAEHKENRIKKYKGSNEAGIWWTRTPFINGNNAGKFIRNVNINGEINNEGYFLDKDGIYHWDYPTNPYGVLIAFSI